MENRQFKRLQFKLKLVTLVMLILALINIVTFFHSLNKETEITKYPELIYQAKVGDTTKPDTLMIYETEINDSPHYTSYIRTYE